VSGANSMSSLGMEDSTEGKCYDHVAFNDTYTEKSNADGTLIMLYWLDRTMLLLERGEFIVMAPYYDKPQLLDQIM